jgi:predicted transcriptional regulator
VEQTVEELKPSIELASIDTSTNVAVKRGNLQFKRTTYEVHA